MGNILKKKKLTKYSDEIVKSSAFIKNEKDSFIISSNISRPKNIIKSRKNKLISP